MVKVGYVYGLVDHQVERPPGRGISIADDTTDSLISVCSEGCIVSCNGDRSVIV